MSQQWLAQQLSAANELVNQGSALLRQNEGMGAFGVLAEANIILDMAEAESPDTESKLRLDQLRAQSLNELGVIHQRGEAIPEALAYHKRAADLCESLIERGVDYRSNATAVQLNYATLAIATENLDEAEVAIDRAVALVEEMREDGEAGIGPLAFGAFSNAGFLELSRKNLEKASEQMEQAISIAEELAEAGEEQFHVNAAQACQQFSVILYNDDHNELAVDWGQRAEKFSEMAFEAFGEQVLAIYIVSEINLISFHYEDGNFADAEDCLWKALEVLGDDPRLLARGLSFYEDLRKQANPRLEKGNLPREEVEEGYTEIQARIEAIGGLPDELFEDDED